ncbi:MAG: hypothetical protein V1840_03450 [Candidatus Omnitrophota bacterium]
MRKKKKQINEVWFKKNVTKMITLLITVIVIPIVISYGFYLLQKRDEQKNNFLTGSLDKSPVDPAKEIIVQLGNIRVITGYDDLVNGINLRKWINIGYDYPIKIKIDGGKLVVSASFNDKNGKMIAQIVDNQWVINRDNYCDRNFSINTLEVVNRNKVPLLQVDIRNGNHIFIGGVFYFPTIRLYLSDGNSVITGDLAFDEAAALKKMKRIFKYPGNANLGIRAEGN